MFFIEEIVFFFCYVFIFVIKFDLVDNVEEYIKVKRNVVIDE